MRARAQSDGLVLVDFSAEDFSLERQKNNVLQAIEMRVDGMILGAVSDGLESSVDLLQQSGIPVVSVGVPINHEWISAHVGTSSREAATLAGTYILKNSNKYNSGKKVVIFSGDPDQENARIRGNTPASLLRKAGYQVTVRFCEDWSGTDALQHALKDFSVDSQTIAAAFSAFEPATIAMVEAAEKYKLKALLVGFDWSDKMKEMIQDGRLHAAITQNPEQIGDKGMQAMAGVLRHRTPPHLINVPPVLITVENVTLH